MILNTIFWCAAGACVIAFIVGIVSNIIKVNIMIQDTYTTVQEINDKVDNKETIEDSIHKAFMKVK